MTRGESEEFEKLIKKVELDKLKIEFAKGLYQVGSPELGICEIAEYYINCCLVALKESENKNQKA